MTKQLPCLIQKLDRMNFFQESYVMSQVGEERVFCKFRMLNLLPAVECPKAVERFCASARRIHAEAGMANESASFWEKVRSGFVDRFAAAAASFKIEIVAPHVASVQKPLRENI